MPRYSVKRHLSDYPVVYIPLGLLAFALVAICSAIGKGRRPASTEPRR